MALLIVQLLKKDCSCRKIQARVSDKRRDKGCAKEWSRCIGLSEGSFEKTVISFEVLACIYTGVLTLQV